MRVLVVETASPKRVRATVQELLASGGDPGPPEVCILCSQDPRTLGYFSEIGGARVLPVQTGQVRETLRALRRENFDLARIFWTGEKKYRRMKLLSLFAGASSIIVDVGDGNIFRLTWKAVLRFLPFRLRHPLPSDHADFVPRPEDPDAGRYYRGEKVLLVQSAPTPQVLRALEILDRRRLFREPLYSVFCRDDRESVERFRSHPLIHEVRVHTESREAWRHLREFRRERLDAVVVFFTGDPGFWKIKYFAFLLGARHKVVFNENNDCFYFSIGSWISLLAHRLGEKSGGGPVWYDRLQILLFLLIKTAVFPVRFAWLLLVWLRLRLAG